MFIWKFNRISKNAGIDRIRIYRAPSISEVRKFGLAGDIKNQIYTVLRLMIAANKRYYKKTTIQDMDIEHEVLRRQIEMAKNLEFLPFKKFAILIEKVDEVGRLIGGWKKKINK